MPVRGLPKTISSKNTQSSRAPNPTIEGKDLSF
jgi:hypothetical protein